MLRQSFTAVLERNQTFDADFTTEPYEVAWSAELRIFVRVLAIAPGTTLTLKPQISPDGLFWCDEGSPGVSAQSTGVYSSPLREYGHWLRLTGTVSGESPSVRIIVYLALKE